MKRQEPDGLPSGITGELFACYRVREGAHSSTKLLRQLEDRQLVSGRILLGWLVDTLATANLAQIGFVLQLLGDRLPEMGRHAAIARVCVRVSCAKLVEVSRLDVSLTAELTSASRESCRCFDGAGGRDAAAGHSGASWLCVKRRRQS